MRRLNLRIDVRAQIKAWRAAILVGQHLCADMNVSLPDDTRSPFDSAHSESLPERSQQLRRLSELQPEQIGNHLACYVIAGWTKAPGHKKNLATWKQFGQRLSNRVRIGNSAPLLDPQTQRKNLARDEWKVCVLNIAKQKLRAGVEKDDAHSRVK